MRFFKASETEPLYCLLYDLFKRDIPRLFNKLLPLPALHKFGKTWNIFIVIIFKIYGVKACGHGVFSAPYGIGSGIYSVKGEEFMPLSSPSAAIPEA